MAILKHCCICFPVRFGAIILGCLTFATSAIALIRMFVYRKKSNLEYFLVPKHLILIVVSVVLILAVHLKKPKLVLPWLFVQFFFNILFATGVLIYDAVGSPIWQSYAMFTIFHLALGSYFWLCGYACYQRLIEVRNCMISAQPCGGEISAPLTG